jgi:hypothetical protein
MKKLLFLFLVLTSGISSLAQQNYFYLAWDYNIPMSNKNWLDSGSPNGGAAGYRFFISDEQLSVGLDINWATYDQYESTQTFQQTSGAITTDYFKYIYNYGAVVSGQYYFPAGDSELFFPYAGLGLGASLNEYTLYYNIYTDSYRNWGFLARPEAGVVVKFGKYRSLGAIAAVHYDYSTNKQAQFNYSNFSALGFKIGIVAMTH